MNASAQDVAATIRSLWNFGDPAASEAHFRDAASRASPADALELRTQIARTWSLRRRFDDAHRELDAIEAAAPAGTRAPSLAVRIDLERGRSFRSAGDAARARPLFERAFATARDAKLDDLAVDAAHMVALVAQGDERIAWNRRAIDLAAASSDPSARQWAASLLHNLGWDLHDAGRAAEALPVFEQALAERRRMGGAQGVFIARWTVARCLRTLGRLDEALAEQRALEAEMQAAGKPDGYVHEEIAELLLAKGDAPGARPHFARAWELLSTDDGLKSGEPQRLERMRRLAQP